MKRTKLSDRRLPDYTRGEEIMNMVTHIVGGAMGIAVLTLCVIRAALHGNVYGIWLMVSHKVKSDRKATLRFSNDIGSDAQTIEIEILNDSTLSYRATGSAVIKKVVNRKLVKIPTQFQMVRMK